MQLLAISEIHTLIYQKLLAFSENVIWCDAAYYLVGSGLCLPDVPGNPHSVPGHNPRHVQKNILAGGSHRRMPDMTHFSEERQEQGCAP